MSGRDSLFSKLKTLSSVMFWVASAIILAVVIWSALGGTFNKSDEVVDLDNFHIDELSDEDIVSKSGHYSYMSGTRNSGTGTQYIGKNDKYDKTSVTKYAEQGLGLETLMITKLKSGTVEFDITNNLESGDMLVVVIKDGVIVDPTPWRGKCKIFLHRRR